MPVERRQGRSAVQVENPRENKKGIKGTDKLVIQLKKQIRKKLGPIAITDEIEFVDKLPKTRSGKIMRRVLKAMELGQKLGDTSTLAD